MMKTVLFYLWHKIVGEPSTGKAVSSMNDALRKLESAVNWQKLKAELRAEKAKIAAHAAAEAEAEAARAKRVAEKLSELLK